MAFSSYRAERARREENRQNNSRPENRCCTNCAYYHYRDGDYVCDCDRATQNVVYRMPAPSVARTKVCGDFVPSDYNIY